MATLHSLIEKKRQYAASSNHMRKAKAKKNYELFETIDKIVYSIRECIDNFRQKFLWYVFTRRQSYHDWLTSLVFKLFFCNSSHSNSGCCAGAPEKSFMEFGVEALKIFEFYLCVRSLSPKTAYENRVQYRYDEAKSFLGMKNKKDRDKRSIDFSLEL